ncbi:MAG TPA: MerR family transcriptional regulator [Candidatus Dormibacteraeota bacterium]|jgi:DNA-binding transcriptional MerR regulator|nr:MerR family transcriptional regulator [Candidatus Dormibacteraeota bacterium]
MDISIGQMARLTGLPVKTVRYYSDIGLAPEADRSAAGYRRYDQAGLARVELVRTLRDLGFDLATIRRVLERQAGLAEVAAAHADAIDVHIRQLKLRRALLRAIARRDSRPEEVQRMSAFARTSADEAGRIMEDFIASVFAEHPDDPFAARMRAALPELPEDPSDAQIDAWVELAGLVGDAGFRARVRQMVTEGARLRATSGIGHDDEPTQRAGRAVVDRGGAALAAGVAPESAEAAAIVDELVGLFATAARRSDDPAYRTELAWMLETFSDQRVERYWQLIGIVNGWPQVPSLAPVYEWFVAALRAAR